MVGFVVRLVPVVVKLRVSGLRIWVTVIHIVARIWILRKQNTQQTFYQSKQESTLLELIVSLLFS